MKKAIYIFAMISLFSLAISPALAGTGTTISTGLTPDTSGGATPIVKVKWEMNVAREVATPYGYLGTDDSANPYSQFLPSGQFEMNKKIALCAIVTDPDGLADIDAVYSDVFYPWDINKTSADKIELGDSHVALPSQSGLGCGKLMQEDELSRLDKYVGIELFCNKIQQNNNNLPLFNAGYSYAEICKADGELMKEKAAVFCGEKDLSYEDASGVYTVWAVAQDGNGKQGKLSNEFVYLPLTAFGADFTSINYGDVRLNTHKIIEGDLTWNSPVNSGLASVRNVGNTRAAISVKQNDMGFGKTYVGSVGTWNVKYDARIGSDSAWAVYDPDVTTLLDDELDLSELDEIDFSIDVSKFPPDHTGDYVGTMTLSASYVPHLICPQT